MIKVSKIEIVFPFGVEFPPGFEQALDGFVNLICAKYRQDNPKRTMWPAGHGSKPLFIGSDVRFDDSTYQIQVSERENYKYKETVGGT